MYWEKPGKRNSENTVDLAVKAAQDYQIRHIVVASNSGDTARLLKDCGLDVVCVTHQIGFKGPGIDEMSEAVRAEMMRDGFKILTTTHLFANIERAATNKFGGIYVGGITSHTLRMFGQGVKVCAEITVMALDAGMIPFGEDIIAIAGSGRGADTALVIRPAHSHEFFNTEIREIICKPRQWQT
jgi:uncharacterized protein